MYRRDAYHCHGHRETRTDGPSLGGDADALLLATLTLAEVHAALTYYYDHKAEIDACFEEDRQWGEGHEERRDEYLRQKTGK